MLAAVVFFVCLTTGVVVSEEDQFDKHDNIVKLTDKTFNETVFEDYQVLWFILFYDHSNMLTKVIDEWTKLSLYVKGFMKIGVVSNEDSVLIRRYHVHTFPTVMIFSKTFREKPKTYKSYLLASYLLQGVTGEAKSIGLLRLNANEGRSNKYLREGL